MYWVWRSVMIAYFVVSLKTGSGYGNILYDLKSVKDGMTEESCYKTWQDAYAELLQDCSGAEFYICDIDCDGSPELLIGGPVVNMGKYADYDVYTYRDNIVKCLGTAETLSWSSFWLDGNCGILGYSYGAGGGGTYRYYIDNDALCYDGEVDGYYYDSEDNCIEWFRGADGSKIIVTEETKYEYERIWNSMIELERYTVNNDTILKVIYGGMYYE